jgi:hypothetical protein
LTTAGGIAAVSPFRSFAQQAPKLPMIGFMAHCLTQNVTGQLLADDWDGATESVRWPLWR